ncbi:MAG: hypothetical protein Q9216_006538 [Gyalolechia sp. 2 TL-2023]
MKYGIDRGAKRKESGTRVLEQLDESEEAKSKRAAKEIYRDLVRYRAREVRRRPAPEETHEAKENKTQGDQERKQTKGKKEEETTALFSRRRQLGNAGEF